MRARARARGAGAGAGGAAGVPQRASAGRTARAARGTDIRTTGRAFRQTLPTGRGPRPRAPAPAEMSGMAFATPVPGPAAVSPAELAKLDEITWEASTSASASTWASASASISASASASVTAGAQPRSPCFEGCGDECNSGSASAVDRLPEDVLGAIFEHLCERPRYLAAAAGVCKRWRERLLSDDTLLAAWNYDDTNGDGSAGDETPSAPNVLRSPVHTGRWTMGTTAEDVPVDGEVCTPPPQASASRTVSDACATPAGPAPSASSSFADSPRTPSPVQFARPALTPLEAIERRLAPVGRYVGSIDIRSSNLNAAAASAAVHACPRLKVLRVNHLCDVADSQLMGVPTQNLAAAPRVYRPSGAIAAAHRASMAVAGGAAPCYQPRCGCAACPPAAFSDLHVHCPGLEVAEFVLQHVAFGRELRPLMHSLGQLKRLNTLAIELRKPAFGASVRSACLWGEHARVSAVELRALLDGTPAAQSLASLSINRCDPGKAGAELLRRRAPALRALALHSDVAGALGPRTTVGGLAADSLGELGGGELGGLEALALGQVHTEGSAGRGAHEALAALQAPALRSLCVECLGAPPPAAALLSLRAKCPHLRTLRVSYAARGVGEREDTIRLPHREVEAEQVLRRWEARVRAEVADAADQRSPIR